MNKLSCTLLGTLLLLSIAEQANAVDMRISGYGSIVAGMTLDGDVDTLRGDEVEFVADFYDVGIYAEDVTFEPESLFAVQADIKLAADVSVTAQLVAKGVDDFEPEFDWYYLTYRLNSDWKLQVGRRNIPMYYYSEFTEVGYAYPWMRPAANLYWWQITQFNGVTASYNFFFKDGDYANTLNFFYGNERTDVNREVTYYNSIGFYGHPDGITPGRADFTGENWENILGANWNISHDMFDLRISLFTHDLVRTINFVDNLPDEEGDYEFADITEEQGQVVYETTQNFFGVGGSVNLFPFTVLFDYNYVWRDDTADTVYPTYLLSLVYSTGKFQPFISYSKADHETDTSDDLEEHSMWSIGLRYNFIDNAAFKIQYDDMKDEGFAPNGWDYHGDASVIAMGVDFVF